MPRGFHDHGRIGSEKSGKQPPRVLAVSSGGGHWVQLLRLIPAFAGCDVTYATVNHAYRVQVAGAPFRVINDATRWNRLGLLVMALRLAWMILTERPGVIVSTGAAPGYFALRLGKYMGCRTVWIDSIANAETMSLSGAKIRKYADLWLTQWAHLERPEGPWHMGAVL
jgi:hypothetical protein